MNDKIASYNLGRYESLKKFNHHHYCKNIDLYAKDRPGFDQVEFQRGRIDGIEEILEIFIKCHKPLPDFEE